MFVATKKGAAKIFFSPLSFVAVFGSGMDKNQDPGSGINITRNIATKTTLPLPVQGQACHERRPRRRPPLAL